MYRKACRDKWEVKNDQTKTKCVYKRKVQKNKAGYTATPVACGWAGAILEVSGTFGQEQQGQNPH